MVVSLRGLVQTVDTRVWSTLGCYQLFQSENQAGHEAVVSMNVLSTTTDNAVHFQVREDSPYVDTLMSGND